MAGDETFDEWRARTAPSAESMELARTATLPVYLAVALFGEDKVLLLCLLALWYPTGLLKRRWLESGARLDDRRLFWLGHVRLGLVLLGMGAFVWPDPGRLAIVAVLALVAVVEMRWHLLGRVGQRLQRFRDRAHRRVAARFRQS